MTTGADDRLAADRIIAVGLLLQSWCGVVSTYYYFVLLDGPATESQCECPKSIDRSPK